MKKFTSLAVLAIVLSSSAVFAAEEAPKPAAAEAHPYTAKSPKLTRTQVDALLAKPEQLTVIDLRRPDEISKIGGFPAYLNIQISELEKSLAFIPKDRSVITVSNHAGRGGKGADLLASKGFKVAGAVGAQDYEAEGGTLTKIAVPPPKPEAH